MQTLTEIRTEAAISRRLWVKPLGMLQQNWCVLEPSHSGAVDLVFFDDHGEVFDWLSLSSRLSAQYALDANGFSWMWSYSRFYRVAGMPRLPETGNRERSRPVYSSGEYWMALNPPPEELGDLLPMPSIPTSCSNADLCRFTEAQDLCWYTVVDEIARCQKETHWMWFVFPQLRGLGSSRYAQYFGLASPQEAADYWDDDVLGDRLRSCVGVLLGLPADTEIEKVFGKVDAMKLRSCMTVFENVSYQDALIVDVLDRYFGSERCARTLEIIKNSEPARRMRISHEGNAGTACLTLDHQRPMSEKLRAFIDSM